MSVSTVGASVSLKLLYEADEDPSEKPPMESSWSSLILNRPNESIKAVNYKQGLYDPGSGEICTKYVPLSASSVLRHVYYNYPSVVDPGIKEALLDPEPKTIYPDDGQKLYLDLCKETGLCPIHSFYEQLLGNNINLRYYGVQQMAFRVIAMSLKLNKCVTVMDLTDNWISEDGCFHLGQMLAENCTLRVLILNGCRIGAKGARNLVYYLPQNRALRELNLSRNKLTDDGVKYLAKVIILGADVCNINLSYNNLTDKSLVSIIDALEINNKLTHLNFSWNMLKSANAIFSLCNVLGNNKKFLDLDLSWNSLSGLRIGKSIALLLTNPNISNLNLGNNKIFGPAIKPIAKALENDAQLRCLDLSANPISPEDAYKLLLPMLKPKVKLERLVLDNVMVAQNFVKLSNEILSLEFRRNAEIIYGGVFAETVRKDINMKDIVLNRIDFIAKTKYKKKHVDIALIVMALYKMNKGLMEEKPFISAVKQSGFPIPEELATQLTSLFAGPPKAKSLTVDLSSMIEFFKRKWPERKLPPTPPPESKPEPEPEPEPKPEPEPVKEDRKTSEKPKRKTK